MTYSKLPGVYFSETVATDSVDQTVDYAPLFIVKSTSSIAQIDDQVTYFEGINAFSTIARNKGLNKTIDAMRVILNQYQASNFYVYNVATDTSASMVSILEDCANKEDIIDIIFIEETKSAQANDVNTKIKAIQTALADNFTNGAFRTAIVIPYGTVHDAVTNKESGVTTSSAVITSLSSVLTGVSDGRIFCVVPDEVTMGVISGHIIATPFYHEVGFESLNIIGTPEYEFTLSEMLTLQNMGVCFLRKESRAGVDTYRINLGVTTSFADSAADGLIKSRKICDEVLRQIKTECENIIKSDDVETEKAFIQKECDNTLEEFIQQKYLLKETTKDGIKYKTKLTANVEDRNTINISGSLIPAGSLIAVNVSTVIE